MRVYSRTGVLSLQLWFSSFFFSLFKIEIHTGKCMDLKHTVQ